MRTPLYDTLFHQLEQTRWTLASIPFARIERSQVTSEDLAFVQVNCCFEMSALYATRMFLRDFQASPDFCQFVSIWYYEEMKHYLALREYLKQFDLAPNEPELRSLNVDLNPAPWTGTLAMHFCGELRLGMWYRRWSEVFEEPVLKSIYALISDDEYRHANAYKLFMYRAVQDNPTLLLEFLQMCKWMMYNPEGDKHPTTLRLNGPETDSVRDRIPNHTAFDRQIAGTITPADEANLSRGILSALSHLSGRTLTSLADLVRFTRELQRGEVYAH